jgi:hypothetical protein
MELSKIENVVFGGIDMSDYPKFCDAYIESADYNGRPATEAELEIMQEDGEIFYNLLHDYIH